MLLEKSVDLLGTPEVVVDGAFLCSANRGELDWEYISGATGNTESRQNVLFSLLRFVESIVLLKTLTAKPQASLNEHSSL